MRYWLFILLLLLSSSAALAQPLFYSQSLQKLYYSLPQHCRLNDPGADTTLVCPGIVQGGSVPVAYGVDSYGMLAHIGYRFLRGDNDTLLKSPVIRFLERETLALLIVDDLDQKLVSNRDNGLTLLLNDNTPRIDFYRSRSGLADVLQQVTGMNIRYEEGRRYRVDLNCGQGQSLTFFFAADAELLSDMDKQERDARIAVQLSHHKAKTGVVQPHLPACNDATMQKFRDTLYICKGRSYIIPQMNGNLYYLKTGDTFKLVFHRYWVSETLANVMLASTRNDYTLRIVQRKYGGEVSRYEMKFSDFYDYFSNDFDRYFSIETLERDRLSGTLILSDRSAGSIHIAHISVDLLDLLTGGVMDVQFDANIPQHNLEALFGKKMGRGNDGKTYNIKVE